MVVLATTYLGLDIGSPLVASSSPLTGDLDMLRRLQDAGVGAVVLPSLFQEELEHDALAVWDLLDTATESHPEASSYFPELAEYRLGPDPHLELVAAAKAALDIPVIASLNGVDLGGWVHHAKLLEAAGADAVELNLYLVAADPTVDGRAIEARYVELVRAVRAEISVPLAVKIGPFFTALAHTADQLAGAGADGLVLFNRFYQPDLDLETLSVTPHLVLSTSDELRLPLRWIGILHGHLHASLAASGGVHTAGDAAKVLLAGADVAMMASALLRHGPEHVATVAAALATWMVEHDYESVDQLRGSASRRAVADPESYERANYRKMLRSYGGPQIGGPRRTERPGLLT